MKLVPNFIITQDILRLISEIDEFKGAWLAYKNQNLDTLKTQALRNNAYASTRIDYPDEQPELQETYSQILVEMFHGEGELSEPHIRQLHARLFDQTPASGQYKTLPNHMQHHDRLGNPIGFAIHTSAPVETQQDMKHLIHWYHQNERQQRFHPLIAIALFSLWFQAIHPFAHGNGVIGRLLTHLLLHQSRYEHISYMALDSLLLERKEEYLQTLRKTQAMLNSPDLYLEPWLMFFLNALKKQKDRLSSEIKNEAFTHNHGSTPESDMLPTLALTIIRLASEHERLTASTIETLTGGKRSTIKLRLKELVESGYLLRFGHGKATWYRLGDMCLSQTS